MDMKQNKTKQTLFWPVIASVCSFILIHLIYGTLIYISDILDITGTFSSKFPMREYLLSTSVFGILYYWLVLITTSALFIYTVIVASIKIKKIVKSHLSLTSIAALLSILATLCLMVINHAYFPRSIYAMFDSNQFLFYVSVASLLIIFGITALQHWKVSLISIAFVSACSIYNPQNTQSKDNVIIVGIDSLRPELIASHMPFLNEQLNSSVIFDNSYTLFARTYPSWISILTGRFPSHNGAQFNLIPDKYLANDNLYLPKALGEHGYYSVYASDERRFSNLNETHGFNEVIGPKTGANDFLLGRFSDIPLLNTLSLSFFGKWLLPEIYANRAANHLYYPEEFSQNLSLSIKQLPNKPIFFAVHFCLAHWPYTDAKHIREPEYAENPDYPNNLRKIDLQIKTLFSDLSKKGILENSKIIFLSDHGESFGLVGTGIHSVNDGSELAVFDMGHGTNILSPTSHKVLLAFKNFNIQAQPGRLTSLIDIFPTVMNNLEIPFDESKIDGQNLAKPSTKPTKLAFESGITLSATYEINKNLDAIANQGMERFSVLTNGLLRIKDIAVKDMKNTKQVGFRIDNYGLYMGKFLTDKESILYIDHTNNTYQEITNLNDPKVNTMLKNDFCNAYSNMKASVHELCNEAFAINIQ